MILRRAVSLKLLVLITYFFGCFVKIAYLDRKAIDPKVFRFDYYCYEDEEESVARGHLGERDIFKGQIDFAYKDFMPANFNCTVVVVATGGLKRDRLSFYFTHFDMGDDCGPGESWLEVADGGDPRDSTSKPKPIQGLPPKLCGRNLSEAIDNSQQFTTESWYLRLRYQGNNPPVGSGFSLIFQHFADPPCEKWQHRCNNDRCIDKALVCTAHNPCGDNSGCPYQISTGLIAGITIGCTVAIVLTVLFCKFKSHLKQRCCGEDESDDEDDDQQAGREMSEFTPVPHSDPQDHVTAKYGISTNHDTDNMPPPPAYDVALTNKYGYKDS